MDMTSGILYTNIDHTTVDLFHLTYNPDSTDLFDMTALVDERLDIFNKDKLISYFNSFDMRDPINNITVSYKNKKNVDSLLDVFSKFYSNTYRGIRPDVSQ